MSLTKKMLIGFVLGIVIGTVIQFMHWDVNYVKPFGDIFIKLMKMLIIPLMIGSLISGIAGMGDMKKLGRVAIKAMAFYILTTLLAIILGVFLTDILKPGVGMNLSLAGEEIATSEFQGVLNTILGFIPDSPVKAMSDVNVIQTIIFCILVGVSICKAGAAGRAFLTGIQSFAEAMYKMVETVMGYAPIGVCALMATTVGQYGLKSIVGLGKMLVLNYVALVLFIIVFYLPLIVFYAKIPLKTFLAQMRDPAMVAFSSNSSMAALPVNINAAQKLGVNEATASFLIPLGNTVNMAGTAMYFGIVTNFVAQAYGIELSIGDQAIMILLAVTLIMGAVGVPGYILVIFSSVFAQVGLPISGVNLIGAVDSLIGMGRTVVNVLGDAVVAIGVAKSEGELNYAAMKNTEK